MNIKRFKIPAFLIVFVMSIMFCGYTKEYDEYQSKVYDDAGLFTEYEIDELQEMCVSSANQTKLDVVVATINDSQGKSSMVYADDFYDDMGFGYDQGGSGLILLMDMDNREIYISTEGIAIQYFNDNDIDNVLDDLYDYMVSEDYYNAAVTFIDDVNSHVSRINNSYYEDVESWFKGNYTDYEDFEKDEKNRDTNKYRDYTNFEEESQEIIFANPLIDLLIAAVVSIIIVLCMTSKSKSRMTVNANTYMNRNKFNIHRSMDTYLRTTVSKTKIQSSSGSSHHSGHSGGSHHRSSSGRSHGGGGRKF